jgi:dihydrodipicolinate synthase/N-acetylneuraminate lyase
MKTSINLAGALREVFAVPPLCRKDDSKRSIDFEQNDRVVRHIMNGGITCLLYGGNAFLYHLPLTEYEGLLDWLSGLANDLWVIPSIGPTYGRAIDQALLIRNHKFPCLMVLPCSDPRDVAGLEQGYREIAETADAKLILYLKDENNFGADKEAGLDAVARLVDDGVCIGIKYAVVRQIPAQDSYLDALLKRVGRDFVISGIGERPAVIHMRDWKLPGFTTGSGCIAPSLSRMIFEACSTGDSEIADTLRTEFIPIEDLRDAWGPAKVLHSATDLTGVAQTGPVPPYLSALNAEQLDSLAPIACALLEREMSARSG